MFVRTLAVFVLNCKVPIIGVTALLVIARQWGNFNDVNSAVLWKYALFAEGMCSCVAGKRKSHLWAVRDRNIVCTLDLLNDRLGQRVKPMPTLSDHAHGKHQRKEAKENA